MSRKLLPLNPRQMVGLADGNSLLLLRGVHAAVAARKAHYRGLEQRRLCDSHEPAGEAIRQDG